MLSIIVPVYKVEPYIRQCVDSIIAQTYRDLEILLIDDGSPDRCGEICDEYAEKDNRVRVFHTENRGLSAARNLGICEASGEYIAFVDSDDWIEPDMYETLLENLEATKAEICCCGSVIEYKDGSRNALPAASVFSSNEAVRAVVIGRLSSSAWDKIFSKDLFSHIRFPEGHVFEDIRTLYRLYLESKRITVVPRAFYHYRQRSGSIMQNRSMPYLIEDWNAHKERYLFFRNSEEFKNDTDIIDCLIFYCAESIAKTWQNAYGKRDWSQFSDLFEEMSEFSETNLPMFGEKGWPIPVRFCTFMSRKANRISLFVSYFSGRLFQLLRRIRMK